MRFSKNFTGPLEASVFVEGLRGFPAMLLAVALIAHALIWAIAMQLAEPSPPPEMAVALALGREWQLGYAQLPPLAAWLSEAIYAKAGSLFLLRLASALCVALAGWIAFLLARRIAGDRQGAIAVLLLVGVYPVAFPGSPLTGDVVQMPLVAGAILAWWIAIAQRQPNAWIALGVILGASLYAGPQGIALLAVLVLLTLASSRARAAIARFDAVLCILFAIFVCAFIAWPRIGWLWQNGWIHLLAGAAAGIEADEMRSAAGMPLALAFGHLGFLVLIILAAAFRAGTKDSAPVFVREPVGLFSRRSVFALALLPAAAALLALYALSLSAKPEAFAPLLLLSGLAAVLFAGEKLIVWRQGAVAVTAAILLLLPPAAKIALSYAPAWFGDHERQERWPAASAARTLTEIFRTRTNRPLEYVVGERIAASQIAALSADRPHVFIDADRAASPWIDDADFKKKGGVVFWEIRGADAAPPPALATALPAFTPEAPLRLPMARGFGDPVRVGWAIVPPQP